MAIKDEEKRKNLDQEHTHDTQQVKKSRHLTFPLVLTPLDISTLDTNFHFESICQIPCKLRTCRGRDSERENVRFFFFWLRFKN